MRRLAYHPNVLAKRIHEPEVFGPKKEVLPLGLELPVEQQIGILRYRRGELADRIVKHLREMSAPEPASSDFRALIEARLLVRMTKGTSSFLTLTPSGLTYASSIIRHHKEALKIEDVHEIEYVNHSGHRMVRCSCGVTFSVRYGRHPDEAQRRAAEKHLRFVGVLPPRDETLPAALQ